MGKLSENEMERLEGLMKTVSSTDEEYEEKLAEAKLNVEKGFWDVDYLEYLMC